MSPEKRAMNLIKSSLLILSLLFCCCKSHERYVSTEFGDESISYRFCYDGKFHSGTMQMKTEKGWVDFESLKNLYWIEDEIKFVAPIGVPGKLLPVDYTLKRINENEYLMDPKIGSIQRLEIIEYEPGR